jgi:LysM repeat protein
MSEPNMKLSRALLIVLVLHVVAVSGIIAFNAIKTHEGSIASAPVPNTNSAVAPAALKIKPGPASSHQTERDPGSAKLAAKDGSRTKQTEKEKSAESAKVYVVAKGDNPVTIAKRFKVSYDELLTFNHIENPRALQIGQRLLIPTKTTKGKKTED